MNELLDMLNKALEMEHAAAIQYRTHAENVTGPYADPIMAHLRELADDEDGHAAKLRTLISDYLKQIPTMFVSTVVDAIQYSDIIATNIASEQDAIKVYNEIYNAITGKFKADLANAEMFHTFEHEIRHILMEEVEHVTELQRIQ